MKVARNRRYHFRITGILLITLLITVVTVATLTFFAIKGQQAELKEALMNSKGKELTLLTSRVEQNLLRTIESPFRLLLHTSLISDFNDEIISVFLEQFAGVTQVLFLDEKMNLIHSYPAPENEHETHLNDWIAERASETILSNKNTSDVPLTIVENIEHNSFLYVLNPVITIDDIGPDYPDEIRTPGKWVMIRFDLSSLKKSVSPLINDSIVHLGGSIELTNTDSVYDANSIAIPLTEYFPGWFIVYTPDYNTVEFEFSRQNILLVSLVAVALLAIILSGFAIWLEIRREYADVELRNRFVANVSHELKTPLSLIRMYAETLLLRRVNEPEKQHEYHRVILLEAERLSDLIEKVLDFSQLRSGAKIYHLTETDLRNTVLTILDQYKPQFEKIGLTIETYLQENLPPVAHDPNGITQILLNLIDNAAKYAASGKRVQIKMTAENNWVDLQIIDFGPGLTEKQHTELLKSLNNDRLTGIVRGSGIGLSMVDLIAKAHHAHFLLTGPDEHTGLKAVISFPAYKPQV